MLLMSSAMGLLALAPYHHHHNCVLANPTTTTFTVGNFGGRAVGSENHEVNTAKKTAETRQVQTRISYRHYEVIDSVDRIDCPFPGCENFGEKGVKRYDNLVAH